MRINIEAGVFMPASFLLIESRIDRVKVLLIHFLYRSSQALAKALIVNDLPFPQEADHVVHIRVIT